MYTVYVLENDNGKIYVGQTFGTNKRIIEHNVTGKGYTSKFRPWKVVYSEEFGTRKEAMSREKYFKTGKGRNELKCILEFHFTLVDVCNAGGE